MSILYKKVWRLLNPLDKKSAKKVYPVITYKYGVAMDLKQIAKKISRLSGVSEGVVNSVLKDFRTELKEELLLGRSVNIDGLGFFYLAARSKGADTAETFTANDITCVFVSVPIRKFVLRLTEAPAPKDLALKMWIASMTNFLQKVVARRHLMEE
jgi:predicted histone-like DNA-binding protein